MKTQVIAPLDNSQSAHKSCYTQIFDKYKYQHKHKYKYNYEYK